MMVGAPLALRRSVPPLRRPADNSDFTSRLMQALVLGQLRVLAPAENLVTQRDIVASQERPTTRRPRDVSGPRGSADRS
jgi:hypothetical protein